MESGIGVDGARFAAFVMATLNDSRSWGHSGSLRLARTAGTALAVPHPAHVRGRLKHADSLREIRST